MLAIVVCQLGWRCGLEFALQVLLCPVTDVKADTESRCLFSQGYFFDMASLSWALEYYLSDGADASGPANLSTAFKRSLPASADAHPYSGIRSFRDEGEVYADAVGRAKIHVRCWRHDLLHGRRGSAISPDDQGSRRSHQGGAGRC
jgi:acetyl esterase/lipase